MDGILFEKEIIDTIEIYLNKDLFQFYKRTSGTDLDKIQGTDFIYLGVRFDFTTNFNFKNKMKILKDVYYIPKLNLNIRFGIRYGNIYKRKYRVFDQPVLVFGYTSGIDTLWDTDIVLNIMKDYIIDIINKGVDIYQKTILKYI